MTEEGEDRVAEYPINKIGAVIKRLEERTGRLSRVITTQEQIAKGVPDQQRQASDELRQAEQAKTNAENRLHKAELGDNVASGFMSKMPEIVTHALGKRTETEREDQIKKAQQEIEAAELKLAAAQQNLDRARQAIEAVTTYSADYLRRQSDPKRNAELIAANKKGGPVIATEKLTQSLTRQEEQLKLNKLLVEMGFSDDPEKMMPVEIWQRMREEQLEKHPSSKGWGGR